MRALSAVLLATVLLLTPAAQADERNIGDPEVVGELNRIANYLNGVKTFQSRFIQVNPDGSAWQGDLYVERPGKFRFEYDAPIPHLLIANGLWFFHVDKALGETNVIPLISTPAHFLVRDDISFRNGLTVTRYQEESGIIEISIVKKDDEELGEVTLTFSDRPLELRKWAVRDVQDNLTQVTLQNTRYGVRLSPKLFRFVEQREGGPAE